MERRLKTKDFIYNLQKTTNFPELSALYSSQFASHFENQRASVPRVMTRPGKERSVQAGSGDSTVTAPSSSILQKDSKSLPSLYDYISQSSGLDDVPAIPAAGSSHPPPWSVDNPNSLSLPSPAVSKLSSIPYYVPADLNRLGLVGTSMQHTSGSASLSAPSQLTAQPESEASHRPGSPATVESNRAITSGHGFGQEGPKLICSAIYRETRQKAQISFLGDHKSELDGFQKRVQETFGSATVL
ncbi:hypothetical protein QFC24_006388 [Naganishia onofrii]|uniref:Uncharacterized protein n=1 Tax=Naganishia onofrii TaxID=1851511 RepID=A0ACC2X2X4_9TREE|nr:hypothetical protein QFC24_006388 [Naganishia onofrii]